MKFKSAEKRLRLSKIAEPQTAAAVLVGSAVAVVLVGLVGFSELRL